MQAAAHEISADRARHNRGWRLGFRGKATLLPVELVWKPAANAGDLPGEYRLSACHDSSYEADVMTQQRRNRQWGTWRVGQQQLWGGRGHTGRNLHAFTQLHVHGHQTAMCRSQVSLGLAQQCTFTGRQDDSIGRTFAYLELNPRHGLRQRELGEGHPQVWETTAELYYSALAGFAAECAIRTSPGRQQLLCRRPGGRPDCGFTL